ncbi:hypothetical protein, partial [Micromonospora craniellae]|uniref:hypothetical protein n=1 Tax=Micromonospora craniellae TaxID=2294034 RepID=UPI001F160834
VQTAGQTGPICAFAQQDRTRVTDQTLPARADDQPLIPPATLTHQKGAPASAVDMDSTPKSLQVRSTFRLSPSISQIASDSGRLGGADGWRSARRKTAAWSTEVVPAAPPTPAQRVLAVNGQWLVQSGDPDRSSISFCVEGHVGERAWIRAVDP